MPTASRDRFISNFQEDGGSGLPSFLGSNAPIAPPEPVAPPPAFDFASQYLRDNSQQAPSLNDPNIQAMMANNPFPNGAPSRGLAGAMPEPVAPPPEPVYTPPPEPAYQAPAYTAPPAQSFFEEQGQGTFQFDDTGGFGGFGGLDRDDRYYEQMFANGGIVNLLHRHMRKYQ